MLKLFSKTENITEQESAKEKPKSNYDEVMHEVSEFNKAAKEKASAYVPSIVINHGASESFIESVDGKDMFVPISAIEAIQSSGGGEQGVGVLPSYIGNYPSSYFPRGGVTQITITTKAGIVYSTSIEYTCADILLKALRSIWVDGVTGK